MGAHQRRRESEGAGGGSSTSDELDAGGFSSWLAVTRAALRGERDAEVPCHGCTACCTSSQFVEIAPDERDTLAHVPAELLFPAPRRPKGHVLLGYDEHGRCPMLVDGACSIYQHRPRACRTYDCRVLPAAGVELDDGTKAEIAARVRRWRFRYPSAVDVAEQEAVRAAARYLDTQRDELDTGDIGPAVPTTTTHLAVAAIELHELFLGDGEPAVAEVRVALRSRA